MSAATHSDAVPEHRQHDGSIGPDVDLKAGRRKVARSRGVLSGILLLILGAWAALAPFIGPYFDFGFDPRSGDAFHWTSGRGLYEVLPGGVAALAGIILLVSASRFLTVLMAWLAALAGVWLVVAPSLDVVLDVGIGGPPADAGTNKTVALTLLYFFATGVVITLVAGIALGRLSVHSVRDVRAAERRAETEAAAAAEAERQEAERRDHGRRESERLAAERRDNDRVDNDRVDNDRDNDRRHDNDDTRQHPVADDRRTAALPVVGDRQADRDHDRDHDRDRDRDHDQDRTAVHPVSNDAYAAPSAGPYEQSGNRDAAGSSGYVGHRAMGQPDAAPDAPTTERRPVGGAHEAGEQPYTQAPPPPPTAEAPQNPVQDPAGPPPPGGMEQYRYGTPENPAPPEEPRR